MLYADASARSFAAAEGDTVLDAMLAADVPVAWSCRAGICGTCRARRSSDGAEVLLCRQALQVSGEEYALDYLPHSAGEPPICRRMALVEAKRTIAGVWRIDLELELPFPFRAGQYAALQLPTDVLDQKRIERYFSMASAPGDHIMRFYLRDYPDGTFGRYLSQNARPGDMFKITGPFGTLTVTSNEDPLLLIGWGTGVAPLLSVVRDIAVRESRRAVALVSGARLSSRLVGQEEAVWISQLMPRFSALFAVHDGSSPAARSGGLRCAVSESFAALGAAPAEALICGSASFCAEAAKLVTDASGGTAVRTEAFTVSGSTEWNARTASDGSKLRTRAYPTITDPPLETA